MVWQIPPNFDLGHRALDPRLIPIPQKDLCAVICDIQEKRMGWYYGRIVLFADQLEPRIVLDDPDMATLLPHFRTSECGRFFSFVREWHIPERNITHCPLFIFDIDRWALTAFWLQWGFHYEILDFQPEAIVVRRIVDHSIIGTNGNPQTLPVNSWLPFSTLRTFMTRPSAARSGANREGE